MPFGHVSFSLSALDLQMIMAVKPGENWRAIPETIPSKRLEQIRRSGGRTTLYGRLHWDKPSYTITTYFNRPGNGCYIHPEVDRVISPLEAARIQSFTDNYRFMGSKASLLKQIGNAVPPLLAYIVARRIKEFFTYTPNVIDLFSGAGGMSLGFEWAGFEILLANDWDKDAIATYSANAPTVETILGDVTEQSTVEKIDSIISKQSKVDVIVGGPPCQGFSHAGKRLIDDPRNSLYREFVGFVDKFDPSIFIMENVEGILTINEGRTFESIQTDFASLGYHVIGRKLLATHFGIPQKRKRVFLIGSKVFDPSFLFPTPILHEPQAVSVREAIGDIPFETVSDLNTKIQANPPKTFYQTFMQGGITANEYYEILSSTSAEQRLLF